MNDYIFSIMYDRPFHNTKIKKFNKVIKLNGKICLKKYRAIEYLLFCSVFASFLLCKWCYKPTNVEVMACL